MARFDKNGRFIGSPPDSAPISCALSGDNILIAGVSGSFLRIFRVAFTLAAGTVTFKDGANLLSGAMAAAAGVLEDPEGNPIFMCGAGNGFLANLSGTNQLSGTVWYTTGKNS